MHLKYSKKLLEHFRNPHNVGKVKNADVVVQEGSPACGDMLELSLKVDKKTKKIKDIKFKSYGCAANIATVSIMTDMLKGKTIKQAEKFDWKDIGKALKGIPLVKVHCSILAVKALKKAIEKYKEMKK